MSQGPQHPAGASSSIDCPHIAHNLSSTTSATSQAHQKSHSHDQQPPIFLRQAHHASAIAHSSLGGPRPPVRSANGSVQGPLGLRLQATKMTENVRQQQAEFDAAPGMRTTSLSSSTLSCGSACTAFQPSQDAPGPELRPPPASELASLHRCPCCGTTPIIPADLLNVALATLSSQNLERPSAHAGVGLAPRHAAALPHSPHLIHPSAITPRSPALNAAVDGTGTIDDPGNPLLRPDHMELPDRPPGLYCPAEAYARDHAAWLAGLTDGERAHTRRVERYLEWLGGTPEDQHLNVVEREAFLDSEPRSPSSPAHRPRPRHAQAAAVSFTPSNPLNQPGRDGRSCCSRHVPAAAASPIPSNPAGQPDQEGVSPGRPGHALTHPVTSSPTAGIAEALLPAPEHMAEVSSTQQQLLQLAHSWRASNDAHDVRLRQRTDTPAASTRARGPADAQAAEAALQAPAAHPSTSRVRVNRESPAASRRPQSRADPQAAAAEAEGARMAAFGVHGPLFRRLERNATETAPWAPRQHTMAQARPALNQPAQATCAEVGPHYTRANFITACNLAALAQSVSPVADWVDCRVLS